MGRVYIFFADGFEDIEGLAVVDLLRRAGIDIQTVSIKETREVTTSHGVELKTDLTFGETDFSDAELLVLPGGMPGTRYLGEYQPLVELLERFYKKKGRIAAICAAPSVFAKLGFLNGRKATSYPSFQTALEEAGAVYTEEAAVVDGHVTTSRGFGTAIDFGLALITQLKGKEKAEEIRKSIVYHR